MHSIRVVLRQLKIAAACVCSAAFFVVDVGAAQPSEPQITDAQPADAQVDVAVKRSGTEWLFKMNQSIQQRNYQISMVVHRPNLDAVPYLWRHGVFDDGVTMEQLNSLNGPGKEFIRVNKTISVFEPDVAPYSVTGELIDGPIPNQLLSDPLSLQTAYEFIAVGRGRVSGRAAQQIRIVSRDNTRFSYQLWVDENNGMPLKFNMLDGNGQLIKQVQVTQMVMSEKPDPFFARINHDVLPPVSAMSRTQHQHQWRITYMPTGMREVKRNTHRLHITGQVVEYAMLTDGLVEVSVYVMPVTNNHQNSIFRHETKTLLMRTDGDIQVSVIGEIPPQTANKIAMSLASRVR
ncbi:MucB/RseB C-terminal domain-containing protein [Alteromonas oceanisediminis]|uniref:MucB/RseB C-terminal domain-containing protein n=1 Tax=Alteromonas oceanisediminis TaxID=2836180 RepID=UPI001BD9EC88|nr:MucB/RseB C-terminal domain-containing protein [Alteromonas oceanisediminis]MBT0585797.1 MucB/RseB C-terminal domain-containing protein [Alteromonas oceanisediminis]